MEVRGRQRHHSDAYLSERDGVRDRSAACCVYTCRRLIDLSDARRYTLTQWAPTYFIEKHGVSPAQLGEFFIGNDEFCIGNDEFCIQNGEFCVEYDRSVPRAAADGGIFRYIRDCGCGQFTQQNKTNDSAVETILSVKQCDFGAATRRIWCSGRVFHC